LNRSRSKQAVGTPPAFLRAVRRRLRIAGFALDLEASPENAICAQYYTKADDALTQPWTGHGAAESRVRVHRTVTDDLSMPERRWYANSPGQSF
jgi:hypothetical protein